MFKARLNPIAGKMAHSKRILTQTVDALRRSVTARSLWYASWMGMSYTCRAMLMTSNSLAAKTKSLAYQRTPWHNRSEGPMALQPKDEVATSIDTRWYCHISSCWQRQPVSCWWLPRGTSCHTCQFASRRPKNWVIAVRKMLNPENQQSKGWTSEINDDDDVLADWTPIYISNDLLWGLSGNDYGTGPAYHQRYSVVGNARQYQSHTRKHHHISMDPEICHVNLLSAWNAMWPLVSVVQSGSYMGKLYFQE